MRPSSIFFLAVRFFIGLLLIVTGTEKLLSPYQNFLYVVQGYQFLPSAGEEVVARIFPWIELFVGLFLVLGLWLEVALRGAAVLFLIFIIIVGQALIRKLPISECGCFGQLLSFPLPVIFMMDSMLLMLSGLLLLNLSQVFTPSLDRYLQDKD